MKQFVSLLVLGFFLGGCIQYKTENRLEPAYAPTKVEKSFKVESAQHLKVQKSSLGKMFLLRASVKNLNNVPAWENLKPLVVVFQQYGNQLGLFQIDTMAAYTVIDTQRLIGQFNIASETQDEIEFDWGSGFKVVFQPSMFDPSDATALENERQGVSTSVDVISSFVKFSEIKDNRVHVRQASRIRYSQMRSKTDYEKAMSPQDSSESTFETLERALEVDYVLSPYIPNPNFMPKETDPLERVGFFLTAIGKKTESTSSKFLISHWDFSKPVTFALSKYFPPDVKQAVKEGILYWNLVLEKPVIQVVEDFDPESSFPERTVVVHWLPWEDAGAAWADLQADPLTGEIMGGQIYITSVFLHLSRVYPEVKSTTSISLAGMSPTSTCHFPSNQVAMAANLTGAQKNQYLQDELRHVVAHEAGHTLGLRHNFAASSQSALNAQQINEEKKKYVADPAGHEGAEVSTSIMDYIGDLEEGLLGRWILKHPLKYDSFALSWASNSDMTVKSGLAYCTDEHIENALNEGKVLYQCERFDAPANPFNMGADEAARVIARVVRSRFEGLVDQIFPADSDTIEDIDAVLTKDPKGTSLGMNSICAKFLKPLDYLFNVTGSPLAGSPTYFTSYVGVPWDRQPISYEEVAQKDLSEVLPGQLLREVIPLNENQEFDTSLMQRQLDQLKSSSQFSSGVTVRGRKYRLSSAQQDKLGQYLSKLIQSYAQEIASQVGQSLETYKDRKGSEGDISKPTSREMVSGIGQEEWISDMGLALKPLIMAHTGTQAVQIQGQSVSLQSTLPSSYLRKSLIELLAVRSDLNVKVRSEIRQAIFQDLQVAYNVLKPDSESLSLSSTAAQHRQFIDQQQSAGKLSSEAYLWLNDQVSALEALDKIN